MEDMKVNLKMTKEKEKEYIFGLMVKDGVFEASVQGRLDTITAPDLLKRFQDVGDDVKAIHLDVSRMAYISSAGLRVLVMMVKKLDSADNFKMTGVSSDVRKILESSGLDRLLLR